MGSIHEVLAPLKYRADILTAGTESNIDSHLFFMIILLYQKSGRSSIHVRTDMYFKYRQCKQ